MTIGFVQILHTIDYRYFVYLLSIKEFANLITHFSIVEINFSLCQFHAKEQIKL